MSPERYARIRRLLSLRQPSLTVCLEQLYKPHNASAIVRSCDAVGVHKVHAVVSEDVESPQSASGLRKSAILKATAMGSEHWVETQVHTSIDSAVETLKQQDMQVLVTNLSPAAVDFREVDYTQPTAILLGQEKLGVSAQAKALADKEIIIPMVGMVQSLNVSVAAALILYEAQRQRQLAGMYNKPLLDEASCQRTLFAGGFPNLKKICDRKGLTYPYVNSEGVIEADDTWWQELQYGN
ncbi:tRNA (guanosine(18)-2'-O)-methyltransferase TrmH [Paraglaciecola sp. 2405UD69-4]|uniref:tRNA (guanosine(18)-2'-O)-methyltransferase TrmH n=1 Tax=Paraglaciecola sp. 2405UD69-4 TaxID=3391836 RepID=UPI0039C9D290